jgi:hypothetical protein
MFDKIELAIAEIQQPRSRFQLQHFVLGQHATTEMQYFQVCLELQDSLHRYKDSELAVQIDEIKMSRLLATGDEIDELEAKRIELNLHQVRLAMIGAQRELTHLIEMWNSFPKKFTRDEIEAAQPEYWQKRLTANASAMIMGGSGVNAAHIEAMQQAGFLENFINQSVGSEGVNDVHHLESN